MTDADRHVTVIGAISVDSIFTVPALPQPGETVLSTVTATAGGGKAANMAVSAAAHRAPTFLIGAVGDDNEGDQAVHELETLGVDVGHVRRVAVAATGRAAVPSGPDEHLIAAASGANDQLDPAHVADALRQSKGAPGGTCLLSAEVADEVLIVAAKTAHDCGLTILYNADPARPLPDALAETRPTVIANLVEARTLTGCDDPVDAARALKQAYGVGIVTLGGAGGVASSIDGLVEFAANEVDVLDTTGAGDAFCGAVAAVLATTQNMVAALYAGVEAGGRAASHLGARTWVTA